MSTVVVTGVSGFIGGQTALALARAGHAVIGVDQNPLPDNLKVYVKKFDQCDFASGRGLLMIDQPGVSAVVHCAGTSLVGPSKSNPQTYFHNNVGKTLAMLDFILELENRPRVIYSSSAAIYGNPVMVPCQENDPAEPISVYGKSKLMIEWILDAYSRAYGLNYVAFRYFNAAGADPGGLHGQTKDATHLIARIIDSAKNDKDFICYGKDYDTKDGTCIRDYIHVDDIAQAHMLALNSAVLPGAYNLGNSVGFSNLDVARSVEKVTGKLVTANFGPAREGDPAVLTADSTKFTEMSAWRPKYSLDDMIQHAWNWHSKQ
jgi:UDP-glucose 4-epimerase